MPTFSQTTGHCKHQTIPCRCNSSFTQVCRLLSIASWTTCSEEWDLHVLLGHTGIWHEMIQPDITHSCSSSYTLSCGLGTIFIILSGYIVCFCLRDTLSAKARDGPWSLKVWDESSCREEAGAQLHGPAHSFHWGHREQRAQQARKWGTWLHLAHFTPCRKCERPWNRHKFCINLIGAFTAYFALNDS